MQCKKARRHLTAYLDGELDARLRKEIEDHLAGCGACETERKALERVRQALEDMEMPPFVSSVSPDALLARARSGSRDKGKARKRTRDRRLAGFPLRLRPAVALGTGAAVIGIIWVAASRRPLPVPTAQEFFLVEEMELFENLDLIRNLALLEELEAEASEDGGMS